LTGKALFYFFGEEQEMDKHHRIGILGIVVVLALLASAVWTVPVRADDGTPPATETPSTETPPTADGSTLDVTATPAAPADQTTTETLTSDSSSTTTDSLAGIPDGTAVVALNADGDVVPLATQEAAEIVATGDPIWCPASVALPVSGGSGCTISYTKLSDLLTALAASNPTVDGTIWIEKTYDSSVDDAAALNYNLNGSGSFATMSNYKLTVKGGWNGIGTSTIDTADPSEINVAVVITNWHNDVTLSDLDITGVSGFGLQVYTTKNIILTRVKVHNNTAGAYIDNTAGTGAVTVSSSQFNANTASNPGLQVGSNGAITLNSVTANGNSGSGAIGAALTNSTASTAPGVTLTGDNIFDNNNSTGLVVYSKGAITINDLEASGNGTGGSGSGASLNNTYGPTGTPQAVTLTGTNIFTENHDCGLTVQSYGNIKANNLISNSNTNDCGASLDNTGSTNATHPTVTLTGANLFKYNKTSGLSVYSKGTVTLNNVTASYTTNGQGLYLDNCQVSGGNCTMNSSVTFTGTNVFNGNYSTGLEVHSGGTITLNNITANDNGLTATAYNGVKLDNSQATASKSITLTGKNTMNNNYWTGLVISSKGAVTLNNLTASDNVHGEGVYVDNCMISGTCTGSGAVTLLGYGGFNNNYDTGLHIYSNGAITTNNVTAGTNGIGASYGHGVWLVSSDSTLAQAVTVSGSNNFTGNYQSGLSVQSKGTIKVNSAAASGNGIVPSYGYGLQLDNTSGTSAGVTMTGISALNANYTGGLYLHTKGAISLSSITASKNVHGFGADIYNSGSSSPQNVTLTGTNAFSGNYYDGLILTTHGTITANNLTASGNGAGLASGIGAALDNSGTSPARDVILTGSNTFSDNLDAGLVVNSLGNIKLNSVTASDNGNGEGLHADNCQYSSGCTGTGSVTLTGTNTFNGNHSFGLDVYSGHVISLNSVTASSNGIGASSGWGALLNNTPAASAQAVTLTGTNSFDGNYDGGLQVWSIGAVTASNLNASGNLHNDGVALFNDYGSSAVSVPVTLTGVSTFNDNFYYGLAVSSYGVISVNTANLTANGNGIASSSSYGVRLDNSLSTAATLPTVTLKGTNTFNGNYDGGLFVQSKSTITLNSLTASSNTHGDGVSATNITDGKGITLTGTNTFNDNYSTGLSLGSKGPVSVNNSTANGNGILSSGGLGGAYILNSTASAPQPVKLTGTNTFNGNYNSGLYVDTHGAIAANNLTGNSNGGQGITLDNQFGSGGVTLTGANAAVGNGLGGVDIRTTGTVTMTKVTADGNTGTGLQVVAGSGNVFLTCASLTNNGSMGLFASTTGTLTLTGVVASGNTSGNISFGGTPIVVRNCPLP
jgi:hypothetical protein